MVKLGKVITIIAVKRLLYVWFWWPYQLHFEWYWQGEYHSKIFQIKEGGDRWEL